MAPRVCIVSSGSLAHGPRVVKEADALAAAGFAVRVVGAHLATFLAEWDRELAAGRPWRFDAVRIDRAGLVPRARWLATGLRQRLCRALDARRPALPPGGPGLLPERAFGRLFDELLAAAAREPADLFIAHNAEALPPAARAAARQAAPVAFDAEDDHLGEYPPGEEDCPRGRLLRRLEAHYLPRCRHVTAASRGIADALACRYGLPRPTPVYNVFPWADRRDLDRPGGAVRDRLGPGLSLCWYSQTVGLNRGLQDAIRAAGRVRGPVVLHVRGHADAPTRAALERLAGACGLAGRLHFQPPVPPGELLARTADHDVGLALEQPVCPNRLATVTNKLFFYLLAGLAVAATDTPGQRAVLATCPAAGLLYPPGDDRALAAGLQGWLDRPDRLAAARAAALDAARSRWNWEAESRTLVAVVARSLGRAAPTDSAAPDRHAPVPDR